MLCEAKTGKPVVVCGQGPAPAGASIAHYRGHLGLDIVPGTGLLPACVPGTFETYMLILRDHGTMRLRDVLEPAIGYARNGYPLVERGCATIATVEQLFLEHWPTSAAVYLPGGKVPAPNSFFTNVKHAETYERILKEAEAGGGGREAEIERARRAWSQGFVAEAIDAFCRRNEVMDVSGRPHKGVLTAQDMATWLPTHRGAAASRLRQLPRAEARTPGRKVPCCCRCWRCSRASTSTSSPPPIPTSSTPGSSAPSSPTPTARRSTAIRSSSTCRWRRCCRRPTTPARRKLVGAQASMEQRPGTIDGYAGRVIVKGARAAAAGAGEPTFARLHTGHGAGEQEVAPSGKVIGDTVHIDIIDKAGNMFTATPSGGWLQSSPVIPALGWPLGSRGQMFWLEEGLPGSLAPGKRPRSTLSVGMALRDGAPYMSWGTPGGDQQDQWSCQFFLRHASKHERQAEDEPAGGDRRAGLAHRALPAVVLAEDRTPRRAGGGRTSAEGHHQGAGAARPQGRGRPRLVGRPPQRRRAGRRAPQSRRQCAGHAGLCGGAVTYQVKTDARIIRLRHMCVL